MPKTLLREMKVRDFMSREVITGTPDEPISELLGRMKAEDVHEIPIVKRKKLVGLVSMASIARRRDLASNAKAKAILHAAPEVTPDLDVAEAAELILSSGHRSLPVLEKGKLVGLLSRTDVIRALAACEDVRGIAAKDVMTPEPQCVTDDDTVARARTVMAHLGERAVPIVDRRRKLVGVVGLKDLADLFARPKAKERSGDRLGTKDAVRVKVGSLMQPPITVPPDASLTTALELMTKRAISTMIVVEEREPLGIITSADLMEVAAGFREREGLFVQISGLEEQPDVYDQMYDLIQKAMRRITPLVTPRILNLHVHQYKADGDHSKWSVRARFATDRELYHFKHFDWDLFAALDGLLDQLEAHIKKEKDRRLGERKRRRS